jgi:hypothetical protein
VRFADPIDGHLVIGEDRLHDIAQAPDVISHVFSALGKTDGAKSMLKIKFINLDAEQRRVREHLRDIHKIALVFHP